MDAITLSPTARIALASTINKTPELLRGLSLREVTVLYGTSGLYVKLALALKKSGLDKSQKIKKAVELGLTLHEGDLRTNGNYADHLLRVTLRMIETYGIRDPHLIAAGPLHDVLEDHASELVEMFHSIKATDSPKTRQLGYEILQKQFGETADIVLEVTKSFLPPGADKIKEYKNKTKKVIARSPKGRVLKLSDFTDNAIGNHYTIGPLQRKLDRKYLDCYTIHAEGLFLPDSLIVGELREELLGKIKRGHARALTRLAKCL